jgi:hypothetical protein
VQGDVEERCRRFRRSLPVVGALPCPLVACGVRCGGWGWAVVDVVVVPPVGVVVGDPGARPPVGCGSVVVVVSVCAGVVETCAAVNPAFRARQGFFRPLADTFGAGAGRVVATAAGAALRR